MTRWRWVVVALAGMLATAGTASAATVGPPYQEDLKNCYVSIDPLFFRGGGCPSSLNTPLGHASADAAADKETGRLSVSASAGGSPLTFNASAGSSAFVVSSSTTSSAGVVRATLTGIVGTTENHCSRCVGAVEGGSASAGVSIDVAWLEGGEAHSAFAVCSLSFDGSPAPTTIVIPDSCPPNTSIMVPAGTLISVRIQLTAIVSASGRGQAAAVMEAIVSGIEVP